MAITRIRFSVYSEVSDISYIRLGVLTDEYRDYFDIKYDLFGVNFEVIITGVFNGFYVKFLENGEIKSLKSQCRFERDDLNPFLIERILGNNIGVNVVLHDGCISCKWVEHDSILPDEIKYICLP